MALEMRATIKKGFSCARQCIDPVVQSAHPVLMNARTSSRFLPCSMIRVYVPSSCHTVVGTANPYFRLLRTRTSLYSSYPDGEEPRATTECRWLQSTSASQAASQSTTLTENSSAHQQRFVGAHSSQDTAEFFQIPLSCKNLGTAAFLSVATFPSYEVPSFGVLRLDSEKLDIEVEGGVRRDDPSCTTAAVPQLRRYRDLTALPDLRNSKHNTASHHRKK